MPGNAVWRASIAVKGDSSSNIQGTCCLYSTHCARRSRVRKMWPYLIVRASRWMLDDPRCTYLMLRFVRRSYTTNYNLAAPRPNDSIGECCRAARLGTARQLRAVCLQLEGEDVRTAFGKSDCAVAANGALQNHPQPQSCHRWASNITATRLRMSTGSPSDRTLHARIRSCILTRTATRTSSGCAQKAL